VLYAYFLKLIALDLQFIGLDLNFDLFGVDALVLHLDRQQPDFATLEFGYYGHQRLCFDHESDDNKGLLLAGLSPSLIIY
jgi:hypothetical protein